MDGGERRLSARTVAAAATRGCGCRFWWCGGGCFEGCRGRGAAVAVAAYKLVSTLQCLRTRLCRGGGYGCEGEGARLESGDHSSRLSTKVSLTQAKSEPGRGV